MRSRPSTKSFCVVTGVYGLVVDWNKECPKFWFQRNINTPAGRKILYQLRYYSDANKNWKLSDLSDGIPLCCKKTWEGLNEREKNALLGKDRDFLLDWQYCLPQLGFFSKHCHLPPAPEADRNPHPQGPLDLVGGRKKKGKDLIESFMDEAEEEVGKNVIVLQFSVDWPVLSSPSVKAKEKLVFASTTSKPPTQRMTKENIPCALDFAQVVEHVKSGEISLEIKEKIVQLLQASMNKSMISEENKPKILALLEALEAIRSVTLKE